MLTDAILASARPLTPTAHPTILREMWGYAEGNQTLVTIVVLIVVVAAIAYVADRVWGRRR